MATKTITNTATTRGWKGMTAIPTPLVEGVSPTLSSTTNPFKGKMIHASVKDNNRLAGCIDTITVYNIMDVSGHVFQPIDLEIGDVIILVEAAYPDRYVSKRGVDSFGEISVELSQLNVTYNSINNANSQIGPIATGTVTVGKDSDGKIKVTGARIDSYNTFGKSTEDTDGDHVPVDVTIELFDKLKTENKELREIVVELTRQINMYKKQHDEYTLWAEQEIASRDIDLKDKDAVIAVLEHNIDKLKKINNTHIELPGTDMIDEDNKNKGD